MRPRVARRRARDRRRRLAATQASAGGRGASAEATQRTFARGVGAGGVAAATLHAVAQADRRPTVTHHPTSKHHSLKAFPNTLSVFLLLTEYRI